MGMNLVLFSKINGFKVHLDIIVLFESTTAMALEGMEYSGTCLNKYIVYRDYTCSRQLHTYIYH